MKRLIVLTNLLLLLSASIQAVELSPNRQQITPKIIGGVETSISKWPSLVAIVYADFDSLYEEQFCAGTLVATNWVLSAAHCFFDKPQISGKPWVKTVPSSIQVVAGTDDLSDNSPPEVHGIVNIYTHNQYTPGNAGSPYDIALLELSTHSKQPLMTIFNGQPAVDSSVTAIGWGAQDVDISGGGVNFPQKLREVTINIISNNDCNRPQAYDGIIVESQLCAGVPEGGKDSCSGDSGGPLMSKQSGSFTQVGVVSFGDSCAVAAKPGVYTRVDSFLGWIKQYVSINTADGTGTGENTNEENESQNTAGASDNNDSSGGGSSTLFLLSLLLSLLFCRKCQ